MRGMNCNELIKELTKLRKQGYGEYPVIYIQGFFENHVIDKVTISEEEGILMPKGIILE